MIFDPGRIRLHFSFSQDVVADVSLVCERPDVARMLRGQPAEQAVALVPLIYSLCGKAQGVAAQAALVAARGGAVEPHVDGAVWAEAAREHAWKLFVDWPRQFGLAPNEAFFVRLMRALPRDRAELVALSDHPLPNRLRDRFGGDEAAVLLAARLTERLGELRAWLDDQPGNLGRVTVEAVAPHSGEARVETARGTLVHRLVLDGDKVADYTIVAPTDLLFTVDGDAAIRLRLLRGLPRDEAKRQARLLVLACDPCVPWEFA